MTDAQGSDARQEVTALPSVILPKIRAVRRIANTARWGLLDVVVWLDEVEQDIVQNGKQSLRTALDDLDLFPTGPENHEDYPEAPRDYRPEDDRDWWCP